MNKLKLETRAYWACPTCGCAYNECECKDITQDTNLKVNDILWQK